MGHRHGQNKGGTFTRLALRGDVAVVIQRYLPHDRQPHARAFVFIPRVQPLEDRVAIEVHDSGPGLSDLARKTLFQPTISFKKRGMGLGLSIARKSALLSGGDILPIAGELGGAGFRVLLPIVNIGPNDAIAANPGR